MKFINIKLNVMKKYFLVLLAVVLGFGFISLTNQSEPVSNSPVPEGEAFVIPENVQSVIDKSCYGCHNSESQNEKGKKKLEFDQLSSLPTHKLTAKLADIAEIINENEMPPEKFLSKKPEATPTAVEKKILVDWATNTAEKLAGNDDTVE
jgi:hypothetical protein